jgi:DNA-directed RNA polymerase subunit RPC12/RpoP
MDKTTRPGKWYFVVDCAKCHKTIPFVEAPSPDDVPEAKQRTITDLRCPSCGHSDSYAPNLMTRALDG